MCPAGAPTMDPAATPERRFPMSRSSFSSLTAAAVLLAALPISSAAHEAGHAKVSRGTVEIGRAGQKLPAEVGAAVQSGDVVTTVTDGSVGITFLDNSL